MFTSLHRLNRFQAEGLLVMRIGIGVMFMLYGFPKLTGGVAFWTQLGGTMSLLGINAFPAFWGFMSAMTEFFGGVLLILGFLLRPACAFLIINLLVALVMHFSPNGGGFEAASHAFAL